MYMVYIGTILGEAPWVAEKVLEYIVLWEIG